RAHADAAAELEDDPRPVPGRLHRVQPRRGTGQCAGGRSGLASRLLRLSGRHLRPGTDQLVARSEVSVDPPDLEVRRVISGLAQVVWRRWRQVGGPDDGTDVI